MQIAFIILTTFSIAVSDSVSSNIFSFKECDKEKFDSENLPLVCRYRKGKCIQGKFMPGFQSNFYEAFLGIPYAKPPVNELRFANPKPFDVWAKNISAVTEKEMCRQKNYISPSLPVIGSEDCLYLNIYRPLNAKTSLKPLPVLVYIHGGGFFSGSAGPSFYGGQYFMDTQEVILVTVAFRLGIFGFLSTGDKYMPGNLALKDQVVALKWINQNIEFFNGDPELVTIFGHSTGGSSVHYHMLSKLSKGLFQRAGLLSGVATAKYNGPELNPLKVARKQAKYLGIVNFKTLSTKDLTNELRKINAIDLIKSVDFTKRFDVHPLTNFHIVIEDKKDPNAFITEDPQKQMERGEVNFVPLLVSTIDNEGFVLVGRTITNQTVLNSLNENFRYGLSNILMLKNQPKSLRDKRVSDIIKFYFNGKTTVDKINQKQLLQVLSDYFFVQPFHNTINLYTKYMPPNMPVNILNFSFKGKYSYSTIFTTSFEDFDVVHCDDIMYYFNEPALFPAFDKHSPEAQVISALIQTIVKFAKTGVPEKWIPIKDCKYDPENPDRLCDFQRIIRDGQSFRVILDNYFNYEILEFWK